MSGAAAVTPTQPAPDIGGRNRQVTDAPVTGEPTYNPFTDPTKSPVLRVLMLAWPVLIQQALILCVGIYDRFLAGNNAPEDSSLHKTYQSAQTTVHYLNWCISSFAVVVSAGSTALVARYVGSGDRATARHIANQSILLAAVFGVLIAVALAFGLPTLVGWLQITPPADQITIDMLRPIIYLLPLQIIELVGIACLVGAGDTKVSLWILGGVALLNIPLAWVGFHGLGFIPSLSYPGITWGTAFSHGVGCLAVLILLVNNRAGLQLKRSLLRPNAGFIRRILRISIPAAGDSLSIALCQLWFLSIVNRLGEVPSAAHGIALNWEALGYLSGQAFSTAAATLVGQNLGAQNPREANRCARTALLMGCLCMSIMGVIFYVLAYPMFRLYCPEESQQAIVETGVPVLRLVAFAMPPLAAIIVLTGVLRGAGDTRVPMVATWIGFIFVRIPLAYYLTQQTIQLNPDWEIQGLGMGLIGAWWAMLVDLFVRGLIFIARFSSGKWKKIKV